MARPAPAPSGPPPKRQMGRVEKFFFVVFLLILIFFTLKQLGIPVVKKTESTEILQHPHR